jgi:hypothetical protein
MIVNRLPKATHANHAQISQKRTTLLIVRSLAWGFNFRACEPFRLTLSNPHIKCIAASVPIRHAPPCDRIYCILRQLYWLYSLLDKLESSAECFPPHHFVSFGQHLQFTLRRSHCQPGLDDAMVTQWRHPGSLFHCLKGRGAPNGRARRVSPEAAVISRGLWPDHRLGCD